jgi:hypothetical protein
LCGLSRANATRRVASCRPISASTAAWSGKWIGKTSSRGEGVARPTAGRVQVRSSVRALTLVGNPGELTSR